MIQISDIKKLTDAANLILTEVEMVEYEEYLNKMLSNFNKLHSVNTDQLEAKIYSIPMGSVLRTDEVKPSLTKEKVLDNAPEAVKGYFRVPRIMEE